VRTFPARHFGSSKPVTPEKAVQNSVVAQLKFHGWFVQRNPAGIDSTEGRPDLEAYRGGFCLFIEVKAPAGVINPITGIKSRGGQLRKGQPEYHQKLRDHGMTIWIVDNSEKFLDDLERFQEELWPGKNMRRLC
jgi:hypothetical protein